MIAFYVFQAGVFNGELKSDWAILIFMAIVSIVAMFKIYYDWKRDKIAQDTMKQIKHCLKILADHYTEEVSNRQMNKLVDTGVEHLKLRIGVDIAKIMIHNNIRTVPNMEEKVEAYVKNAFEYFSLNMRMFKYSEIPLCDYIPDKYLPHVLEYCKGLVMKPRKSHLDGTNDLEQLSSYMSTKFAKLKTEMYTNIDQKTSKKEE